MTFDALIKVRKSVRLYSEKPVSRILIDQCIDAARLAPSACNSQPWSFLVVDDRDTLNRLCPKAFGGIYSLNRFVRKAPVLIVIVTERSRYYTQLGGQFRGIKYNLVDIGIAGDHLTLQAQELGLGTCWLGWFNEKALKKELGLPKNKRIDILISMGYPANKHPRKKQRKSLDEIRDYHR